MALSENEPGHPGIGAEVEGGDHVVAVHQEVALWVCLHCLQFASCPVQTSNCLHLPLHNNSLKEKRVSPLGVDSHLGSQQMAWVEVEVVGLPKSLEHQALPPSSPCCL